MPSRAISRPIAWKTHAKISIPTRSACNQIKQDQRLDLAIPITLHGSLDTCVSAPRLSLSLAFSLSLWLSLSLSLALSLSLSNRAERMTRTKADGERERERGGKRIGGREKERGRERERSTRTFAPLGRAPSSIRISLSMRETGRSQYTRAVMGTTTGSSVFARHPHPPRCLRVTKVVAGSAALVNWYITGGCIVRDRV